jgi:acetylornithine deacetylase
LIDELRVLEKALNAPAARHPMYCNHAHPINFNLGRIEGGEWTSSVPTHCKVDVRIGYYPGRQAADVQHEIEVVLRSAHVRHPHASSVKYEVSYRGFQADGLVVDMDHPMVKTLVGCHRALALEDPDTLAFTATTDVRFFHLYGGIPATCYGPAGSSIHGIDEWVSIDSMLRVATVYALFIARWCGLNHIESKEAAYSAQRLDMLPVAAATADERSNNKTLG